jgi:hypothetical protein
MNYDDEFNRGGYESMVWVQDREGRQFSCYLNDIKNPAEITEEEKTRCMNVNTLIGTERW